MCSICKSTLAGFTTDHDELLCPLRNSYYCSICARYGHLTKVCPTLESRILSIKNTDVAIKEFLASRSIKYRSARKALQEYADLNRMRIVYTV